MGFFEQHNPFLVGPKHAQLQIPLINQSQIYDTARSIGHQSAALFAVRKPFMQSVLQRGTSNTQFEKQSIWRPLISHKCGSYQPHLFHFFVIAHIAKVLPAAESLRCRWVDQQNRIPKLHHQGVTRFDSALPVLFALELPGLQFRFEHRAQLRYGAFGNETHAALFECLQLLHADLPFLVKVIEHHAVLVGEQHRKPILLRVAAHLHDLHLLLSLPVLGQHVLIFLTGHIPAPDYGVAHQKHSHALLTLGKNDLPHRRTQKLDRAVETKLVLLCHVPEVEGSVGSYAQYLAASPVELVDFIEVVRLGEGGIARVLLLHGEGFENQLIGGGWALHIEHIDLSQPSSQNKLSRPQPLDTERRFLHLLLLVHVFLGVLDLYLAFLCFFGDFIQGLGVLKGELQSLLNLEKAERQRFLILRKHYQTVLEIGDVQDGVRLGVRQPPDLLIEVQIRDVDGSSLIEAVVLVVKCHHLLQPIPLIGLLADLDLQPLHLPFLEAQLHAHPHLIEQHNRHPLLLRLECQQVGDVLDLHPINELAVQLAVCHHHNPIVQPQHQIPLHRVHAEQLHSLELVAAHYCLLVGSVQVLLDHQLGGQLPFHPSALHVVQIEQMVGRVVQVKGLPGIQRNTLLRVPIGRVGEAALEPIQLTLPATFLNHLLNEHDHIAPTSTAVAAEHLIVAAVVAAVVLLEQASGASERSSGVYVLLEIVAVFR